MACRVFFVPNTNEEVVDRVDAANGRRSQLFDKMANIVGKAILIWMSWSSFSELPSFSGAGKIR